MSNTFDKPSEEIKARLDIVDIIQEYIPLKKAGANYKALCPFHTEKTPSFFVSQDKQIWHCFGCSEGGDIFSFVMKMEGIEFIDALRLLAKKAGVVLKRQDPGLQTKRSRLLEILDLASYFYHRALLESKQGRQARDYLKKRKISDEICQEFRLGFAPNLWDELLKFMKKKGYRDEEITEAGLAVKKENGFGFYDRFRGRLIFPIFDQHGSTIGFGGRVLEEKEEVAKYINTPKTLVYDKSHVLYGLNKAKAEIRRQNQAIIVEGYMDVLSCYQAGIKNIIASSGTALTEGQIKLIKRYTPNIVLAFDMDVAGDEATKRGIDQAVLAGLNVKVARLPQGKDPDECVKADVKIFRKAISEAKRIMDYYFESIFCRFDIEKIEEKKKAASEILTQISKIPDKIEQAYYLKQLASEIEVEERILYDVLQKHLAKIKKRKVIREEAKDLSLGQGKNLAYQRIFGLILKFPYLIPFVLKSLKSQYLPKEFVYLYKAIKEYYNKKRNDFDFDEFRLKLNKENKDLANKIAQYVLYIEKDIEEKGFGKTEKEIKKELENCLYRARENFFRLELAKLEKQMTKAEEIGDNEETERLTKKFNACLESLNKKTKCDF